jgi:beta-glucosidase
MTLTWENQKATSILDVWFGGTEAGNAVADVLLAIITLPENSLPVFQEM